MSEAFNLKSGQSPWNHDRGFLSMVFLRRCEMMCCECVFKWFGEAQYSDSSCWHVWASISPGLSHRLSMRLMARLIPVLSMSFQIVSIINQCKSTNEWTSHPARSRHKLHVQIFLRLPFTQCTQSLSEMQHLRYLRVKNMCPKLTA